MREYVNKCKNVGFYTFAIITDSDLFKSSGLAETRNVGVGNVLKLKKK
jgi:hypothetical protein